jgi:hypothetical protein
MLILPDSVPYRGCLNEFHVGELFLPFFSTLDILSDPSIPKFRPVSTAHFDNLELECRLCYDNECQNGAQCLDPLANYTCDCLAGYQGDLCQVNIDECIDNFVRQWPMSGRCGQLHLPSNRMERMAVSFAY